MKSKHLLFGLAIAAMASCQKSNDDLQTNLPSDKQQDKAHVCVDKFPGSAGAPTTEGAGKKGTFWANGKTITVKFLNGSSYVQGKIKQYAKYWESYANVRFSFVSASQNADIRIGVQWGGDEGSWSYIGTESQGIASNQPTMNYGWFDSDTDESDFRGTTIHEFGHAIGLIHEQSSPAANIPWNKPVVYNYFAGPPNYWSKAQVDYNVFYKYSAASVQYGSYDPLSIMHYPVPAQWTTNGFSVGNNTVLSTKDKQFIATIYPK